MASRQPPYHHNEKLRGLQGKGSAVCACKRAAHLSLTTGSSTRSPARRDGSAPPKRISPAASSDTSGLSHSENMRASRIPRSNMCQKPGRPPDALDRRGSARPCRRSVPRV